MLCAGLMCARIPEGTSDQGTTAAVVLFMLAVAVAVGLWEGTA